MFMLESHLSTDQNRVVAEVQAAAAEANASLFLTGGAMRDMLGGFPIRDLDFTIESVNAPKIAKAVAKKTGARVSDEDDLRKSVELVFPGGVTAEIAMARQERYAKPGAKPAGDASHDPRRPAAARLHGECDRALAEPRLPGTAGGSDQRPGRSRAQGTADHLQLRALRRSRRASCASST